MGTILNGKYLSMPEQVQKNKNDIQIITEYLENIYKCSTALEESSTSINIEYTNIEDKRDFLFAFLLDNKGLLFKIIDIVGDIVYLEFYSKLPSVDFNYLGEWVAGNNEYHPNDVVLYNGSLYICENTILDSSVAPPQDTTNWSLFLGFGDDIGNFLTNLYNESINDPLAHESFVKPVLVYQNTSPSSGFLEQDIPVDFIPSNSRVIFEFKGDSNWYTQRQMVTITKDSNWGENISFTLSCGDDETLKTREVIFSSHTLLHFNNAMSGGSTAQYSIIPTKIWYLPGF